MAVNEEIVTGKKFRRLVDVATNKWRRYSFWNKAKDTECEDGTDVETKVGAIKGITTSTNVSETGYAADAKTVSEINQSLAKLNNKGLKTLNSNYASYYYKNGNTVYIVADFANKTVPQNGVTLGTLPIEYRPYVEVYGRNGFDNQNGEMMVNRSGVVRLQSSSGSFNYGHFSCCFPCTTTL